MPEEAQNVEGGDSSEANIDLGSAYDALSESSDAGLPAPAPSPEPVRMPSSWSDAPDLWNSLSPEAQKKFVAREQNFFDGIEQYKAGHNQWNDLHAALRPYLGGQDPNQIAAVLPQLLQANEILVRGSPEQKRALITNLIQAHQIQLEEQPGEQDYDPALTELRRRLDTDVAAKIGGLEQTIRQLSQQIHMGKTEEFANDPKNKYFSRVVRPMTELIRSGAAKDLKDAYNKAIWLDESIRAELIAEQHKGPKEAAAEALKQAQTANIKGGKAAPLSQRPKKDVRELLSDRYDELAREAS